MFKVVLSSDGNNDINQIVVFIALETKDKAIALSYLNLLEKAILSLETFPERGSNPRYKTLKNQGYKFIIVENHLVFYKFNQKDKVVTIYRVLHNKISYQNFL